MKNFLRLIKRNNQLNPRTLITIANANLHTCFGMQYIKETFTLLQSNNRTTITLPTTEIINPLTAISAYKVLDKTPPGTRHTIPRVVAESLYVS